ncbi:hypothetical protein [Lentzea sp. NPDC003310]|uniref:Rv1733c family protein n=1 Tax=Lentzea sp. NPDC003310 TaxID=3154447 RepID=UPI0033AC597A
MALSVDSKSVRAFSRTPLQNTAQGLLHSRDQRLIGDETLVPGDHGRQPETLAVEVGPMSVKPMARLVRQAFPYRNELATTGDRIEATVLALGLAVSLLAVPIGATAGSEAYAADRARVTAEQASRRQVDAVLVEDAPPVIAPGERSGVADSAFVMARWKSPDGSSRVGPVQAHFDATAGSATPIWIDEDGEVVDAPLTTGGAAVNGVLLGFLLWSATTGAVAMLYFVTSHLHRWIRSRRWADEWRTIAPDTPRR